jgi:hypothetical protein
MYKLIRKWQKKIFSLLKDAEKKINTQTEQYRKNSINNNSSGKKKKNIRRPNTQKRNEKMKKKNLMIIMDQK